MLALQGGFCSQDHASAKFELFSMKVLQHQGAVLPQRQGSSQILTRCNSILLQRTSVLFCLGL